MNKLKTLNEMDHLRSSRFGRLHPRHGLKLLYWFANDCIEFDNCNKITSECDPESGDFGFHYFENRFDRNSVTLLPNVHHKYYVVGNLNSLGADELPDYVSEDYTGLQDDSNMDRIIVSVCDYNLFDRVYVTEHDDRANFNRSATYRVSKGLLKTISRLQLETFLNQAGYQGAAVYQFPMMNYDHRVVQNPDPRPSIPAASDIRPQKKQESHVVVEVKSESDNKRDRSMNGITIGRYSDTFTRSRRRKRCCECSIL